MGAASADPAPCRTVAGAHGTAASDRASPGGGRVSTGNWSLQTQDLELLDQALGTYVTESRARCALLVDRTGRSITAAGETGLLDQTTFASLAAADFAASDQLARLLGEQEFAALYHAGPSQSMYLADVGGQAILATLFDGGTTLGLVRLRSR